MAESACRKSGVKARRCLLAGALLLVCVGMVAPGAVYALYHTAVAQAQSQGASQQSLPTFSDLPPEAQETYAGSRLYKGTISSQMAGAIGQHTQENYDRYQITKESNLGLPLGSIYLTENDGTDSGNTGKHVEMAVYERAAFTAYNNAPTPQILSTMIYEGKMQVSDTEFIQFSDATKQAFLNLPLAGEGDPATPKVAQMAELMTSSVDANWTQANQMLDAQGKISTFDIKAHFPDMSAAQVAQYKLGDKDPATGHKTADIINVGLQKMFGDQVIENAGLAKGPAVWIEAKVGGVVTPVLFQQYERMAITVNPNNYEADKTGRNMGTTVTPDMKEQSNNTVVQVGLQGQIVYNGLLAVDTVPTMPTATPGKTEAPTAVATATPKSGETLGPEDYQTTFVDKNGQTHKFTYDNKPLAEGLPGLKLTLNTQEDRDDYAELLKRTGKITDFRFKIDGIDPNRGEPPQGWYLDSMGVGGVELQYVYTFDPQGNLLLKYRDKGTFHNVVNDPKLLLVYGTRLGSLAAGGAMRSSGQAILPPQFSPYIGTDATGLRIAHKMGFDVDGYQKGFTTNPWPTFWTIQP